MREAVQLNNAPIREAVIDIRVKAKIEVEQLESLSSEMPQGYGEFLPTLRKGVGINFKEDKIETTQEEHLIGYRSENKVRQFIAQFQHDGFSLSKLSPYENWEAFKREAMSLWGIYKRLLEEVEFKRVAVRYINEISLPLTDGQLDFNQYMTSCPKVPENMPDMLVEFSTRIVVPCQEHNSFAVINSNISNKSTGKGVPFILDIDVFRNEKLGFTESELWSFFDNLRNIKNTAFFGSITKDFVELCK